MGVSDAFISEMLNSFAASVEKADVGSKVEHLSKKLVECKNSHQEDLKDKINRNCKLFSETECLEKTIQTLADKSEDVANKLNKQVVHLKELSESNQETYSFKLEKIKKIQKLLNHLKKLFFTLEDIKVKFSERKFHETAILIEQFQELKYAEYSEHYLRNCKIFTALTSSCNQLKTNLTCKIDDITSDLIKWISYDEKDFHYTQLIFENKDEEIWFDVLEAMNYLNTLDEFLFRFSKNLLTKIIVPFIHNHSAVCSFDENSIKVKEKYEKVKHGQHIQILQYENILGSINQILNFLGGKLAFKNIKDENFKKILRDGIKNKFSLDLFRMLAREVIDKSAPSSKEKIEKYSNIVSLAKNCQKTAEKFCLVQVDDSEVNDLLGNAETAYVAHKCLNLLSSSRSLLKSPLLDCIAVGCEDINHDDVIDYASCVDEDFHSDLQPMFLFPQCQISKSIVTLWQNVEDLVDDITSTSQLNDANYMQLYKCIRGVIQLYINIVPMFHGHSIQTLPFIAALHHNNCMYMAHKLMSFQIKTRNILRQPVDYVEELQRLAVDHFLSLLQQQKANILQNLKSDFGFDSMSERYETTLKSWRKVSLELQHLQKAWNGVLPSSLLYKSIGSLFNTSLEEVVNGITKLEDISEFDAQKLTDLTSVIEKDGIDLISSIGLPSNDSIPIQSLEVKLQQHIEFWIKLKELKFVLNARLMEIRDRWAAGKGPLADAFTKEEMDSLIRALFQNTEMRSAVLAVINRKTDY